MTHRRPTQPLAGEKSPARRRLRAGCRAAGLLSALLWCLSAHTASAQNIEYTQGSVGPGLDNKISIPIRSYPGRGAAALTVTLNYSSRVWRVGHIKSVPVNGLRQAVTEAIFAEHSRAGWTTTLDVPRVEWPKQEDIYRYNGKTYYTTLQPYTYRVARVFIHMPDGSTHELRKSDQVYLDTGSVDMAGTFYAVDGSRLRYDSAGASAGTLYLPDGSRYVLESGGTKFIDRNGNALRYAAATRTWTDALGRTVGMPWPASPQSGDYNYSPPGVSAPYVFRWRHLADALTPDAQGATPALKAISDHYLPQPGQPPTPPGGSNFPQPATGQSLFASASDESVDNGNFTYVVGRGQTPGQLFNPVVLTEVVLPNGLSYKFSYNIFGEIDKVSYPTGGYERYEHGAVPAVGPATPPYDGASRGVKSRRVSPNGTGGADEAEWKYAASKPDLATYLVRVTAPDNTFTESYRYNDSTGGKKFGYGDARDGVTFDERSYDASGTMLRRTLTEWAQTSVSYDGPQPTSTTEAVTYAATRNARPVKVVSLILDTGGDALAKTITYQYDTAFEMTTGPEQVGMAETRFASVPAATAREGAVGSMPAGPTASSTATSYLSDPAYRDRHLLGLVSSVTLFDSAGSPVSKTATFYDEDAYALLAPYNDLGVDNAYVNPGTALRGNPTTVRRYVDAAASVEQGDECPAGVCLETHGQFDQYGNPVNFWDERGIQSRKAYSAEYRHAYLTQTTSAVPDPSGENGSDTAFTSSSTYHEETGRLLTATDANGQITVYSYADDQGVADPMHRLRKVTRPDGGWTKTSYNDVAGNLYVHTESSLDAERRTHAYQFFDKLGRPVRSLALEAGTTYVVAETKYDSMGRVESVSNPFRTTIAAAGSAAQSPYWVTAAQPSHWTTTAYDALGRIKQVTLPDNTKVLTAHSGVYTTVTDQAGRQRRQKTNAQGQVVRVDEPNGAGSLGPLNSPTQPSFCEYDALGNVVRVSQGLSHSGADPEDAASYVQHRYFKYDALSRMTHERQAEQSATISAADPLTGNNAWSRRLTYDHDPDPQHSVSYPGLLVRAEDARHVVIHYDYDQMGRAYRVAYSDGTPAVTSRYDHQPADDPQGQTYLNRGQLVEVRTAATAAAPETSQVYDHDLLGRVVRQRQAVGAHAYTLGYAYNLAGVMTSQTYPSGRVVEYAYDAAARLQSVSSGATTYAGGMIYKPSGNLESVAMGNGTVYSMSYNDARLQLTGINLKQGSSTIQEYKYAYGRVDAATGAVDATKNNGQIARVEGYIGTQRQWQQRLTYDHLGRLASAGEYRGDTLQQTYLLNYDFDVYGNRYQKQSRNAGNPFAQAWVEDGAFAPATNRFNTGVTYDAAGFVKVDSRFRMRRFEYDANGRQRQSANIDGTGAVTSVYDGEGRRVATKAGGVLTNVYVYDAAGGLAAEYGQGVHQGGTRYIVGDHQGSPRAVLNSAGGVVSRLDHLPFGEDGPGAGVGMRTAAQQYGAAEGVKQGYAGMEQDTATSMSHTLWREYDPLAARWTAPDPYGGSLELANPQTFNRYAYVANDPANKVDPLGLMLSDIGIVQTDDALAAARMEGALVTVLRRYMEGQTGTAQRQQRTQRSVSSFGRAPAGSVSASRAGDPAASPGGGATSPTTGTAPKIQWGESGGSYTESQRQGIENLIIRFAGDKDCNAAFFMNGLVMPLLLVYERGLYIGGAGWFDGTKATGEDFSAVGFSTSADADVGREVRSKVLNDNYAQAITFGMNSSFVTDGRAHILFGSRTWTMKSTPWKEVVGHEIIHAAGRRGLPYNRDWGEHDLTRYPPYEQILKACGVR